MTVISSFDLESALRLFDLLTSGGVGLLRVVGPCRSCQRESDGAVPKVRAPASKIAAKFLFNIPALLPTKGQQSVRTIHNSRFLSDLRIRNDNLE